VGAKERFKGWRMNGMAHAGRMEKAGTGSTKEYTHVVKNKAHRRLMQNGMHV